MMPIAPALAIRAEEKPLSYPALTIAGIRMDPSAATVAGPEPEIAAKKQQVTTPTIAKPPVICPTQTSANLIKRLDTPAASMTTPARMKKGIASNANFAVAAYIVSGKTSIGAPIK